MAKDRVGASVSPEVEKGRPTLSACMIVRNEEEMLSRCLESVKNAVDEMIIVDTGSKDRTVEIAESYGAKIYHHPWQNSFSEARNYGLQFATGDWIFQIDADEELEQEDIPVLGDVLRSADAREDVNAIFVAIYNTLSGEQHSKHYFPRIFRRDRAHYEGIVHNQLVYEGNAVPTEIRLVHYGYGLSSEEMTKKHRRTGDLLKQQLEEDPADTFAQMNLVRILRNQHLFDQAIEEGKRFLDSYSSRMIPMHRQMISNDVAYCLFVTGRTKEAEEMCRVVLKENPNNLDVLFTLGGIFSKRGEYPEALRHYKKFLRAKREDERRPRFTQLIVDTYTLEDRAWNNIGECYKNMGLFDEAVEAYLQAIRLNEGDVTFYRNLAFSYIQQNRPDKVEEVFKKAMERGIADDFIHFKLGELYHMQGQNGQAIQQYREALTLNENHVDARNGLGSLLLTEGRLEEAERYLREAERLNPSHIGVLLTLAKVESRRGTKEQARAYSDRIIGLNATNKDLYLELAAIHVECEDYDRAIELFEECLRHHPTDFRTLTDLGTCYAKLGQYSSALIGYRAALQINPRHQPARNNLAALERILGRPLD